MKIAFSSVACPTWDFETLAARGKEYGYDGVEIRGFLNETILTAANVFLSEPSKVRRVFADAGLEVACLASSIAYSGNRSKDRQSAEELKRYIDTAAGLGCGLVKVFDASVKPGQTRSGVGVAMGDWLLGQLDHAAVSGVMVVVENALSFRTAKELWMILDRMEHPSVGVCWDVFNASLVGERPDVSVPVLNSKIQYVHVKDAELGPLGANYVGLGKGHIPLERLVNRLKGIGYEGYVTFEWEKAWLPGLAEPETVLPDAARTMRAWIEPPKVEAKKPAVHAK